VVVKGNKRETRITELIGSDLCKPMSIQVGDDKTAFLDDRLDYKNEIKKIILIRS